MSFDFRYALTLALIMLALMSFTDFIISKTLGTTFATRGIATFANALVSYTMSNFLLNV